MNYFRYLFVLLLVSLNSFAFSQEAFRQPLPERPFLNRVAIIGAGSQRGLEYIKDIQKREGFFITALVVNETVPDYIANLGIPIIYHNDIDELLEKTTFNIAIVSLPHYLHDTVTQKLLDKRVYIIKEKPLALDIEEALFYKNFSLSKNPFRIFTTVQRDTQPQFLEAFNDLPSIGEPLSFTYTYTFNLPSVTSGWRAKKELSGGGVVMDMGYHPIEVITKFFGKPMNISASFDYKYEEMKNEGLEDSAEIEFIYPNCKGTIVLNRHAKEKKEVFEIIGSNGSMTITGSEYMLYDKEGILIKKEEYTLSKAEITARMMDKALYYWKNQEELKNNFLRNVSVVEIINQIYEIKRAAELPIVICTFEQP